MIRGIYLAMVLEVNAEKYGVTVSFPNLSRTVGIYIPIAETYVRSFGLPRPGDKGLVVCYQDNYNSAVWLTKVPDRGNNLIPTELLTEDPDATLQEHPSRAYTIHRSSGDIETVLPDGSLLKTSVSRRDASRTPRKKSVRRREFGPITREDHPMPEREPAEILLEHQSGLVLRIDRQGVLTASNGTVTLRMEADRFVLEGNVELGGEGGAGVARELDAIEVDIPPGVLAVPGGAPFPGGPAVFTGRVKARPGARVKSR